MNHARSYVASPKRVRQFAAFVYLLLGVQSLHAETINIPYIVEAIPPAAIVAVASHPDERILNDGTRIYLSANHRSVVVERNQQKKEISLYGQYALSNYSLNENGLLLVQQPTPDKDRKYLYFDFKTQKRTAIQALGTVDVNTNYGELYLTDDQHIYALNHRTGSMLSFPRLGSKSQTTILAHSKAKTVLFDRSDKAQNVISIASDGSVESYAFNSSNHFNYCGIVTAQILSCETDASIPVVFTGNSKVVTLPKDWSAMGRTANGQFLVAYNTRGEVAQLGLYDLRTGSMRIRRLENLDFSVSYNQGDSTIILSLRSNPIMALIATYVTSAAKSSNHLLQVEDLAALMDVPEITDASLRGRIISDEEFDRLQNSNPQSAWTQSYDLDHRYFFKTSDREKHYVLSGIEDFSVESLGSTGFLKISTGLHRNYVILLDLSTRRVFELGIINFSNSYDYDEVAHTYRAQYPEGSVIYNLDRIRSSASYRIELGSKERAPHAKLPAEVLGTCDAGANQVNDPVSRSLLAMRGSDGGFDEMRLRELLRYHLDNSDLILVAQIFQQVLITNPELAEPLFRQTLMYDRLENLGSRLMPNPCLDDSAEAAIHGRLNDLFTLKSSDGQMRGINFSTIASNIVYGPYIRKFGLATEAIEDALGDRLATGAQAAPLTENIFYSKLYYFARAAIEPIFGRARTYKTDITAVPDGHNVQLVQISSYPSHGLKSRRSAFGFFLADGGNIPAPGTVPGSSSRHSIEWQAAKTSYRADVKVTLGSDLRSLVPANDGLDYKAIRADGKITGLMVVGSNLHETDSQKTLSEYQAFYNERGYSFDVFTVEDFPTWFKDHIVSGEIDYLIKEAHSDGDEKNLFRAATRAHVLVGRKPSTTFPGVQEIIYLATPIWFGLNDSDTQLLPNQVFGQWIRDREAGGHGPLVYINSSCSSFYKVLREITTAHSKALVAIPSITMVSEFRDVRSNVTSVLIDGILKGQDWRTIRQIMSTRQPDINQDQYALPNEKEFEAYIRSHLGFTVETEVHVWDLSRNREVNEDEFNSHND